MTSDHVIIKRKSLIKKNVKKVEGETENQFSQ